MLKTNHAQVMLSQGQQSMGRVTKSRNERWSEGGKASGRR
jgi:hypothetical protein